MAKVMLVEDDNNLREIYEARLQAEGYTIVSARDGEEALVVAKQEKPDLIISDVMMPKISGFEMLDILRNTDELKHVKVIMLTALGQSDDQQRADRLGADRYLVKSQVTLEDIASTAQQLLEGDTDAAIPDAGASAPVTSVPDDSAPAAASDTPAPAADAGTPSKPAAASEPAAPAAEPAASDGGTGTPPQPAAAATTPAPTVSEPALPGAQSSAEEAATVASQIQDFVTQAPAQAPAATAPATEATAEPPASAPATEAAAPADATTVRHDQVMADAVNDLLASTTPAPAPATEAAPVAPPSATSDADTPASAAAPAADKPEVEPSGSSKKVIAPLHDPAAAPDINQLLAAEEAKEAAAQPVTPAAPGATLLPPAQTGGEVDPSSIAL